MPYHSTLLCSLGQEERQFLWKIIIIAKGEMPSDLLYKSLRKPDGHLLISVENIPSAWERRNLCVLCLHCKIFTNKRPTLDFCLSRI